MRTGRTFPFRPLLVLVLEAALAAPTPATAGFTLVTSESALGANDSVDWGTLGSLTQHTFSLTSPGGTQVDGSIGPGGLPQIGEEFRFGLTQLNGSTALGGIDTVPRETVTSVKITLKFSQPVFGFGAETYLDTNEGSVFGNVTATDTNGNSQTFTITNGGFFDGFVGVRSDSANLASLTFFDSGGGPLVSGTTLDLGHAALDSPGVSSVPAPGGLTLAGVGLVGLLGYAWRRRQPVAA